MDGIKNLVLGLVAKQHNISEDKVAELLFSKSEADETKLDFSKIRPDALSELLTLDASRVTTIKQSIDKTETYTKAYNDAKKDVLGKAEKTLAEAYGIEYDPAKTKLDSLVKNIVKKSNPKTGDLTDDNIKKSQIYLALEKSKTTDLEGLKTEHAAAVNAIHAGQKAAEMMVGVKSNAGKFFDAMNPILSGDSTKASNQRSAFLNRFETFGYEKQADGSHILIESDGRRKEDQHGHPITLEQEVSKQANSMYDFKVQDNKGGDAANNNKAGGGARNVVAPADQEAFNKAILEAPTMEARQEISAAFEAAKIN